MRGGMTMASDVYAGKDLGTLDLTITEDMVQHYIRGLEEPNPWYTRDSPFGGPVAPALVFQDISNRFKGWYLDNLFGNLWMRQAWTMHAPVRVGQILHCAARVADRKRDRDVVAQEVWLRDDAGQLVAHGIHHQCAVAERTLYHTRCDDRAQHGPWSAVRRGRRVLRKSRRHEGDCWYSPCPRAGLTSCRDARKGVHCPPA